MAANIQRQTREVGIHHAGRHLSHLVKELDESPGVVSVQRYGKPVLAIMAWDDYEGLMETLEIMKDPEAMDSFRRAAKQLQDGAARDFEELAAELGV